MSTEPINLPDDALRAIDALSRTDHLLVASDFDGTMAPIVDVPADARTDPQTQVALAELAGLAATTVAVVSGRALDVLAELTALPSSVHLVGSHGVEFDSDFSAGLTDEERARLAELNRQADDLAARFPGLFVEKKPASTALHYRHVAADARDAAVDAIQRGPCVIPGVHLTAGKQVVEIAAIETSKGLALERLREIDGATAVVFLGDDVTDESAFVRLSAPDVGVKVGEGKTAADVRIPDTAAVARFLTELAARRREHLGA
ncbi:trehalose-phosphatase [Cumulibacter manganitolerans]|uniref:trehalose-phosphatase n=1 Tax=Cumulibacter manganitolerans TaxID=1884992 RepID=UPI001294B295|nr:trehalose-phosphatase [Cumulibacter manganitolerans]